MKLFGTEGTTLPIQLGNASVMRPNGTVSDTFPHGHALVWDVLAAEVGTVKGFSLSVLPLGSTLELDAVQVEAGGSIHAVGGPNIFHSTKLLHGCSAQCQVSQPVYQHAFIHPSILHIMTEQAHALPAGGRVKRVSVIWCSPKEVLPKEGLRLCNMHSKGWLRLLVCCPSLHPSS